MATFTWSILEVYGNNTVSKVRYLIKAQDEIRQQIGQASTKISPLHGQL